MSESSGPKRSNRFKLIPNFRSFFRSLLRQIFYHFDKAESTNLLYNPIKKFTGARKRNDISYRIITNCQQLIHKKVEDLMIPRSDVQAIPIDISFEKLKKTVLKSSYNTILVYEDNLDNILGFVDIQDLYKLIIKKSSAKQSLTTDINGTYSSGKIGNFSLKRIMKPLLVIAPSMKVTDLLQKMQTENTYVAVVVDEYGGTDGSINVQDILSEVFGQISKENKDKLQESNYQIINDKTILSNARVEVEDLEEILNIKLKDEQDEFDTIGGLVLAKVGELPPPGTKIILSNQVEIEVIEANSRILKQVKITTNKIENDTENKV